MLRLRLILVLCVVALAGSGVAAKTGSAARRMQPQADIGLRASKYARRFLGVRYRYGGASPRTGFDCSGFVAYVFRHFGVKLPHYTVAQYRRGRHVPRRALEPGDLVFFDGLSHVGLYIGRGRFIHAPHTGAHVRLEQLRYGGSYDGAVRVKTRSR